LILFVCANSIWAQDYIKRAAVSAAPHTIETQRYLVQQNFGFSTVIPTKQHTAYTVSRGFLFPQTSAVPTAFKEFKFSLYPNPFSTHINIDFNSPVSGDLQLHLYDLSGRLVWHKQRSAKQQQRIPIEGLPLGAYLMRFTLDGTPLSIQLLQHKNQQ
jgi:hypothetical protein